jgi:sterol desaturase/sphingolipid hydroxylase (fatty acid hydroxylase superfamily)
MSEEKILVLALMAVNGLGLWSLERWAQGQPSTPPASDRRRRLGANLVLTGLLIALNLGLDPIMAAAGVGPWRSDSGLLGRSGLPGWTRLLAVVVVLDGLTYAAHRLLHLVPQGWSFHRVHHSDAHVDVTTAFRQHPLETLWRYSFQLLGAWALGASSHSVAVYLALSALNAQLEHADVSLPWRLEALFRVLFATPSMHRVHHSRRQAETDTNYSNIFSFWDRLFGTYRAPQRGERIPSGLDDCDVSEAGGLLRLPFRRPLPG